MAAPNVANKLAQVPIFAGCSKRELAIIARAAKEVTHKEGTVIAREGERGIGLFLILEGQCNVSIGGKTKARLGLHRSRLVSLDAIPAAVGGRSNTAVSRAVSEKSITLLKDARNTVPLPTPRTGSVLYLSVLDYPSGWRIAAPSRTVIPELRARWPNVEAVEISDRTTPAELDLVRAMAANHDAIVAGIFVRASSGSGRLDLAPHVIRLLQDLSRGTERRSQPFVAAFFGNPYTPMFVPEIPAMLLTYDFSDYAEQSVVKAIAGEIAITGKLPISLPDLFPLGHGVARPALPTSPGVLR